MDIFSHLKQLGIRLKPTLEVSMREAAATELHDRMRLVSTALRSHVSEPSGFANQSDYISIDAFFSDRVIVQDNGRYWSYGYVIDDSNNVTFSQRTEVARDFQDVAMREAQGSFLEATDATGTRWRIRVIRAGKSGNNNYYCNRVLREATPMFNNVRVFVKADAEHLRGGGKSFNQLIGKLTAPTFVEGQGKDNGEIQAELELLESVEVHAKLLEAHQRGMADMFGFSIDAEGRSKREKGQNTAQKITKVNSVDLIIEPGAGGELLHLLEAQQNKHVENDMRLRERMINTVKKHHKGSLPADLNTDDDEQLDAAYREALQHQTPESESSNAAGGGEGSPPSNAITQTHIDSAVRMVEARADARVRIAQSKLPDIAKNRLRVQFDSAVNINDEDVDNAINQELEYVTQFSEAGKVHGVGDLRIEAGETRHDKITKMLDVFFDKSDRNVRSFKECYVQITGDKNVSGDLKNCDVSLMRESLGGEVLLRESLNSASLSSVLGDSITRRMIRIYNTPNRYDVWRRLADVVPVNDFRTQERTRFGGYGDLPVVLEDGSYDPLTSPNDEKATYAVTKKGGTETISIEMIKNDDVGAIRRIPTNLSSAARRTLAKFVLDFLATNPVIYTGNSLFDAAHNNLNVAAVSAGQVSVNRQAMLKQTELDSNDRLGIAPVDLWVPADLEEAAFDLFRRQTNNDTDFVESLQMNVIPVWYWTDVNNWFTTADMNDIPLIEIGFLDGNEEPQLFVQDSPTQGSLFSNDQIKYKIKHVYGGNVLDFRGFQGNIVP